ncbi:hypothetical protein TWF694_007568 [Orbilia ellipsospora]|uniref:Uncharacterized protein n=1 Tax=Orbilia ellipsospora TaxID=2528407 RepID=A0AAV9XKQ4_9PEZI
MREICTCIRETLSQTILLQVEHRWKLTSNPDVLIRRGTRDPEARNEAFKPSNHWKHVLIPTCNSHEQNGRLLRRYRLELATCENTGKVVVKRRLLHHRLADIEYHIDIVCYF